MDSGRKMRTLNKVVKVAVVVRLAIECNDVCATESKMKKSPLRWSLLWRPIEALRWNVIRILFRALWIFRKKTLVG